MSDNRFQPSTPILDGTEYTIHPQHPLQLQLAPQPGHDNNDANDANDSDPADDSDSGEEQPLPQYQHLLAPVPGPTEPHIVPATVNRITSEEKFWDYIAELKWMDASDDPTFNMAAKRNKFMQLSISDQEAFAGFLITTVNTLNQHLAAKQVYGTLDDETERKALCSHIIGRGSVEYALTVDDPHFMLRLLPENTNGKREYHNMMELIPH
jgi:hypothetical protein